MEARRRVVGRLRAVGPSHRAFPYLDYSKPRGGEPSSSSAGLRSDVAVRTYAVGPVATDHLTNGSLARLLREYGEKVSGIKEELAGRMAELLARLYRESEAALADFFKPGFVRLNGVHGPHPEVFEPPIRDGGVLPPLDRSREDVRIWAKERGRMS